MCRGRCQQGQRFGVGASKGVGSVPARARRGVGSASGRARKGTHFAGDEVLPVVPVSDEHDVGAGLGVLEDDADPDAGGLLEGRRDELVGVLSPLRDDAEFLWVEFVVSLGASAEDVGERVECDNGEHLPDAVAAVEGDVVVRLVVEQRGWLGGLKDESVLSCFLVDLRERVEAADVLVWLHVEPVQVVVLVAGVVDVDLLADERVEAHSLDELGVQLQRLREQLREDDQVLVDAARLAQQVLAHVQRRGVRVVQPEAVEVLRQQLHVLLHALPQVRRVSLRLPEPQLHQVRPDHDAAPQVVEVHRLREVLLHVRHVHDPAVVRGVLAVLQNREVARHQRELRTHLVPALHQVDVLDRAADGRLGLALHLRGLAAPMAVQAGHGALERLQGVVARLLADLLDDRVQVHLDAEAAHADVVRLLLHQLVNDLEARLREHVLVVLDLVLLLHDLQALLLQPLLERSHARLRVHGKELHHLELLKHVLLQQLHQQVDVLLVLDEVALRVLGDLLRNQLRAELLDAPVQLDRAGQVRHVLLVVVGARARAEPR